MVRDLRLRFGLILALALMPIIIFSVWQSYHNYQRDKTSFEKSVENAAIRASNQIISEIDGSKAVLETVAEVLTEENCQTTLTRVEQNYDLIFNFVFARGDGRYVCSVRPIRSGEPISRALGSISEEYPFAVSVHEFEATDYAPGYVAVSSFGRYMNGSVDKLVMAGFDLEKLVETSSANNLPEQTNLVIVSENGVPLVGNLNVLGIGSPDEFQNKVVRNREFKFTEKVESRLHKIGIVPKSDDNLYIATSTPVTSLWTWNRVNPFASALVPAFAWLFGFAAIWYATNELLLRHLRELRLIALSFSRGNMDKRVGELEKAPEQIASVARTFDLMADRISERDKTLSSALRDKENLVREVHHRVKNNLQIVISLINIQARRLQSDEAKIALGDIRERINAIALVHKSLYESDDMERVDMRPFITDLMIHMRRVLLLDKNKIDLEYSVEQIFFDSDSATTVAMFIVEAMTNSAKYGAKKGGGIEISLFRCEENLKISVFDSGSGPGANATAGTGQKLMNGFARQLGGVFETNLTESGYECSIIAPVEEKMYS